MWYLGRDAAPASVGNKLGLAFANVSQPSLYYWSQKARPKRPKIGLRKQTFLAKSMTRQDTGRWWNNRLPRQTA